MFFIVNVLLIVSILVSLFIYNVAESVFLFLLPRRFRKKKDITGQKVLITGAGSGLGKQLAVEFSRYSTCLVLLDINKKGLLMTEKLLDPCSRVFIYECDVSNPQTVYKVAQNVKQDVGEIDILVNNAGIVCCQPLLNLPDEKIKQTFDVNTLANFWVCKAFLPTMMAANSGHLVFVASILGHIGLAQLTDYCASKFAVTGFAESLEAELKAKNLDGIKCTVICPAHIDTGLFDGVKDKVGGLLSVEFVAQEVLAGVLQEDEVIFLPFYLSYLVMLKAISPRWLIHKFHELTNSTDPMKNFRGKSKRLIE